MSQLPIGWQVKRLGDLLKLQYGKPLPKEERDDDGAYPAYGANGIKCKTNKFYWDRPSIIVGRKGSAGEVNLTEEKFWPLDVTYFVDFDEGQHDLMFLYYYLASQNLQSLAKGVKPGINRNDVYAIECAYPPLPEQKRIVAILDEAFAGISQAVANAEKNLANARELFESYLNNVFTQKGEGWVVKALGNVCDLIGGGTPSKKNEEFYKGEIPWATVRDMKNDEITQTEFKITDNAVKNSSTNIIKADNVVIATRVGLGKVCLINQDTAINQDLRGIVPTSLDVLTVRYLFWWLKSIAHLIEKEGTGATVQGVKLPFVKSLQIPLPSLPEQKRIVAQLDVLRKETQHLESIYQQKLTALTELKQSILQKAFAGELTADIVQQQANG